MDGRINDQFQISSKCRHWLQPFCVHSTGQNSHGEHKIDQPRQRQDVHQSHHHTANANELQRSLDARLPPVQAPDAGPTLGGRQPGQHTMTAGILQIRLAAIPQPLLVVLHVLQSCHFGLLLVKSTAIPRLLHVSDPLVLQVRPVDEQFVSGRDLVHVVIDVRRRRDGECRASHKDQYKASQTGDRSAHRLYAGEVEEGGGGQRQGGPDNELLKNIVEMRGRELGERVSAGQTTRQQETAEERDKCQQVEGVTLGESPASLEDHSPSHAQSRPNSYAEAIPNLTFRLFRLFASRRRASSQENFRSVRFDFTVVVRFVWNIVQTDRHWLRDDLPLRCRHQRWARRR